MHEQVEHALLAAGWYPGRNVRVPEDRCLVGGDYAEEALRHAKRILAEFGYLFIDATFMDPTTAQDEVRCIEFLERIVKEPCAYIGHANLDYKFVGASGRGYAVFLDWSIYQVYDSFEDMIEISILRDWDRLREFDIAPEDSPFARPKVGNRKS